MTLDTSANPLNDLPMMVVSRRRWFAGLLVGLTIPAALVAAPSPSQADASFTSLAEAQTFHVTVTNDKGSIPTLPQIDAGIGTARATFSSFGGGVARAASPDAGSAASVPALLGALVPTLIPRPLPFPIPSITIPGDITVQSGEKPAKVGTGPYALSAEVTDTSAEGKATLGGNIDADNGVLRTASNAKITVGDDETVTATASSVVDGVKINGLVSIGKVSSSVTVVRAPDGSIQRSSDTKIGLIELAGLELSFQGDEFVSPVGKLPLSIVQVSNLLSKLTGGQFTLKVSAAEETAQGMVSSSLQIIQKVPPPPECVAIPLPTPVISGVTYCGTTTVVYDFGRAVATTNYVVIPESSGGNEGPDETPVEPGGTAVPPISSGEVPSVLPPLDPGAVDPGTGVAPELTPEQVNDLLPVRARFVDISNLYLAVAGFAVLLFLSSTCIRLLGVRNKWTS